MTHVRTIAAIATATIALVLVPQVQAVSDTTETVIETLEIKAIEPLAPIDTDEIIDGVRIVSDDAEVTEMLTGGVEAYAAAGYPIENTEIRYEENGCEGIVGYHAEEKGHHVVVMCVANEWTLLHELGHVWADLYLDEQRRIEWLELRGLDSWHEGDWGDRGTEHVAEIMAYGLYDTATAHVPTGIGNNDYRTVTEAYEWLTDLSPKHRQRHTEATTGHETTARVPVVASRTIVPAEAPSVDTVADELKAVSEYQFPLACGYPRWHTSHGGYGYVDPRDWTHVGVDLYAFEGTPVVSPVHGVVVDAGWHDISGWKVVVEDRNGYRHRMVHLASAPTISTGMGVAAGQQIGLVGKSGNAEGGGPHLHYEISLDGETIDPMLWLEGTMGTNIEAAPSSFYTTDAPAWADCDSRA
ncbi:MAG: M23 family metallopeptidase [Acidimicrobiia bacterium]